MVERAPDCDGVDWNLTTWEGARREQMRRWAALPLERMVAALEEMEQLAAWADSRREDDRAR